MVSKREKTKQKKLDEEEEYLKNPDDFEMNFDRNLNQEMDSNNYNKNNSNDNPNDNSTDESNENAPRLFSAFPQAKIFAAIIIVLLIAGAVLFLLGSPLNEKKIEITSNGKIIAFDGNLTKGDINISISGTGEIYKLDSNSPLSLNLSNLGFENGIGINTTTRILLSSGGAFGIRNSTLINNEKIKYNPENGEIIIDSETLQEIIDQINLENENSQNGNEFENETHTLTIEINSEEGQIILEIPFELQNTVQFMDCVSIKKSKVIATTNGAYLEAEIPVTIDCEEGGELNARITDGFENTFGKGFSWFQIKSSENYEYDSIAGDSASFGNLPQGNYFLKITVKPIAELKGKKISFGVNMSNGNSEAKVIVEGVGFDAWQCIYFDRTIAKANVSTGGTTASGADVSEFVEFEIDGSQCGGIVDVELCKNDSACGNGIEGGVTVSTKIFTLTPSNPKKIIRVSNPTIQGAYGITIDAGIGALKKRIGEKTIVFEGMDKKAELEKYVFANILGISDSTNLVIKDISEIKEVQTNACEIKNIFKESSIPKKNPWINSLTEFRGIGYYSSALASIANAPITSENNLNLGTTGFSPLEKTFILFKQKATNASTLQRNAFDQITSLQKQTEDLKIKLAELSEKIEEVKNKSEELKSLESVDTAVQASTIAASTASIIVSMNSILTAMGTACEGITAINAQLAVISATPQCTAAAGAVSAQTGPAQANICGSWSALTAEGIKATNDLKNTVDAILSLSEKRKINIDAIIENSKKSITASAELASNANNALTQSTNGINKGAFDNTKKISSDALNASNYFTDAKESSTSAIENSKLTKDYLTLVLNNAQTEEQENAPTDTELAIAGSQFAIELGGIFTGFEIDVAATLALLKTATTASSNPCTAAVTPQIATVAGALTGVSATTKATITTISVLSVGYAGYKMVIGDYSKKLTEIIAVINDALTRTIECNSQSKSSESKSNFASTAAQEIFNLTKNSSFASEGAFGNNSDEKKIGILLGNIINAGIIAGAVEGKNYLDCSKIVTLELPHIKTKLNDIIDVSNSLVVVDWVSKKKPLMETTKTNNFFQDKKVSLFVEPNTLTKNGYSTITFKTTEEILETEQIGKFVPFEMNPTSTTENTHTYRIKLTIEPEISPLETKNITANCSDGISVGSTQAPSTNYQWGWDTIDENLTSSLNSEKYLDSTQLTILVFKKIQEMISFNESNTLECPKNPAFEILKKINPETTLTEKCFLPTNTEKYDGKPAIEYFYLNAGSEKTTKMKKIIDFNVLLIRDGYGSDFLADFLNYYSNTTFGAPTYFSSSYNGLQKLINSNYSIQKSLGSKPIKRIYYTTKAIGFNEPSGITKLTLGDTGLYNVKLILYFDGPNGFVDATPKISGFIELEFLEPTQKTIMNYLPIDGKLRNNSVGKNYGTGLSNSGAMKITDEVNLISKLNPLVKSSFKLNSSTTNFSTTSTGSGTTNPEILTQLNTGFLRGKLYSFKLNSPNNSSTDELSFEINKSELGISKEIIDLQKAFEDGGASKKIGYELMGNNNSISNEANLAWSLNNCGEKTKAIVYENSQNNTEGDLTSASINAFENNFENSNLNILDLNKLSTFSGNQLSTIIYYPQGTIFGITALSNGFAVEKNTTKTLENIFSNPTTLEKATYKINEQGNANNLCYSRTTNEEYFYYPEENELSKCN